MQEPWDYKDSDKISKILSDKRLSTRYGGRYGKYLEIYCGNSFKGGYKFWKVERAALEMLLEKYGDVSFREAIRQWSVTEK